jgi:hypothetical protein
MDKRSTPESDGAQWFYILHDQGATVLQLKGRTVVLTNIGAAPYTFVGHLEN